MCEKQYVLNMLDKFAKPGAVFAMVADSYNVYEFCEMIGTDLEVSTRIKEHGAAGGLVVVRPDSGHPATVVLKCLEILEKHFGSETNAKGYRVLNHVRVIQGDGINHDSIREILKTVTDAGFSADNVAFGQGGALLQQIDRDTLKFALKCSAACVNGKWVDVYKDPVTDSGKRSKRGLVKLYMQPIQGLYRPGDEFVSAVSAGDMPLALVPVYRNGELLSETTFEEIRARVNR